MVSIDCWPLNKAFTQSFNELLAIKKALKFLRELIKLLDPKQSVQIFHIISISCCPLSRAYWSLIQRFHTISADFLPKTKPFNFHIDSSGLCLLGNHSKFLHGFKRLLDPKQSVQIFIIF